MKLVFLNSFFFFFPLLVGERPYQCPTCERTFTLKHSLVRHQRIHQKPLNEVTSGGGSASSGGSTSEGEGSQPGTNLHSDSEQEQESEGMERGLKVGSGQPRAQLTDDKSPKGLGQVSTEECAPEVPQVDNAAENSRAEAKPRSQVGLAPEPDALLSEMPEEVLPSKTSIQAEPEDSVDPPSNGFIHSLLEIHTAKPSLEHILPAAELPLVGVD